MKKTFILLLLCNISLIQYGQIIADHTVVDKFDDIPQYYIDEVKKMWLAVPGESHSEAYRVGLALLEASYPKYAVNVTTSGAPEAYTTSHLRTSRATWGDYDTPEGWIHWYGEEDWFTNAAAIAQTKKSISYCNDNGYEIAAIGFGWCYDMVGWHAPAYGADPVYGCRWYGDAIGSPDSQLAWGLDAGDYAITGNSVCMDTYLNATQSYIDYCTTKGYDTKVFFTTGTIQNQTSYEPSYQGHVKHEYIRAFVAADPTRILFDYNDILAYNDDGSQNLLTWNGHTYPVITVTNLGDGSIGHIGSAGAIRLAKAMWWMLARIAGWDGGTTTIPVTGITVTGAGGSSVITTDNGTLQLSAAIAPTNATNQTVTWTIANGTGQATISSTGLVTTVSNGTVTARATANDGSGVYGTLVITISSQVIQVIGITVAGAGGSSVIATDNGTLQLSAAIAPTNATNQTVTWTIANGTGQATISSSGLVSAVSNGTVTARATANDGSGVYGTLVITISSQVIPVTGITVTGAGGSSVITTDNGTLQLSAAIAPTNATNQTVTWSIATGTGQATISSTGLVTTVSNGTVTARATANDGSGVYGTLVITISSQVIQVTGITVAGAGVSSVITTDNGTLQLSAAIAPTNATNQTVTWTIANGTGQATISSTGLVTAVSNGTVTARATANDGSGIYDDFEISISNQNANNQIIADHSVVDKFDDIPQYYIEQIKKMWLVVPGESPSQAYRTGLTLLESLYPAYAVSAKESGTPEAYTDSNLRVSRATWGDHNNSSGWIYDYGEEDWFTNATALSRTKANITYCNTHNLPIAAIGFAWSFELVGWHQPAYGPDPVYGCRWYGDATGSPDSQLAWGLDAEDYSITGNTVCMDTYLNATQGYIDYCTDNGFGTKVFFTTGIIKTQFAYEPSYQGHVKNEYIRNFVKTDPTRILFDYNDILAYNDDGSQNLVTWNGYTYPVITTANLGDGSIGEIGSAGAIRLSKAMWWMLARIAGWDGGTTTIPVTGIIVTEAGGSSVITTDNGTLQLSAAIAPTTAINKTVTWTIANGTGQATISSTGLVTAVSNGTVTARATANDGSGVYGTLVITISSQVIPVTGITVTGAGGSSVITTDNGTLQLSAAIAPTNASNQTVTWSIANGTGQATISSTGLVTTVSNGTVTARATANDAPSIYDDFEISISNQNANSQIIADHSVVDKFDDIPQYYIDQIKKMWLIVPGESTSQAYRTGLTILESLYPEYAVSAKESGTPEAYTDSNLRVSRATWGDYSNSSGWIYGYGEEDWFTNATALSRTKANITYCNTHNLPIAAIGFAWCFELVGWHQPAYGPDPVYGCRWYGDATGSPDSQLAWGLDAEDYSITGNTVCMDTYLNATQGYIDYCTDNGFDTKVFFTTGIIKTQFAYEPSYQGHVKNEYIRNFVKTDPTRILFDYNDILAYNDDGSQNLVTWNGHTYPVITTANLGDGSIGEIGSAGAIRLSKAMWWMLARIAGWDGGITTTDSLLKAAGSPPEDVSPNLVEEGVVIYPNPTDAIITVRWDNNYINGLMLTIYNVVGNLVKTALIKPQVNEAQVDLSSSQSGIYFLELKESVNGMTIYTSKIVKN